MSMCIVYKMSGSLVPSDSTQAMASLMSAYDDDDEGDDDAAPRNTSRILADDSDGVLTLSPDGATG